MSYDALAQHKLNKEHLIRPQVGDYWHENCSPQFLVIWTDGEFVEALDRLHVEHVKGGWRWAYTEPAKRFTIEQFAERLRYQSEELDGATWCDVAPHVESMRAVLKAALQAKKRRAP